MKLEIRYVPTEDLVPYARNAKQHPPEQIAQIAGSLKEFGFINPIVVDKDRSIVAGHGRVLAAQKLGMTEVPTIAAEHLSPTQVKAFRLADNRIAQNGSWDDDLLKLELEELDNLGVDLEALGFDLDELPSSQGTEGLTDSDDVPETPKDVWVKRGELFELGAHRLLCGDSTKAEEVARLMNGEKADMVFTDPPYGIDFQSNFREKTPQFAKLANDDVILDVGPALWAAMADNSAAYICTRWDVYPKWVALLAAFSLKNCVVWFKRGGGLGDLKNAYSPNHEFIIVAHKGVAPLQAKRHPDVWEIGRDSVSEYEHPTQKPVALPAFAIESHSCPDALVLDLFLGSGSTLIACEKTGRKCYGMEIDPTYCQVILERWAKFTGKQWTKIES